MSAGDIPAQVLCTTKYDSDDSSSSRSVFNRSSIPIVVSPPMTTQTVPMLIKETKLTTKSTNDEHVLKTSSQVRCLEDKLNALQQVILDLSNQVHQLKSTGNSPTGSPIATFRTNSTHNYVINDYIHEHRNTHSSRSPLCEPQSNHTCISQPIQMKAFDCFDPSNGVEHFRNFQDILSKTTAALERRDIENHLLKKEIDELRCIRPLFGQNSFNASNPTPRITEQPSKHSHASAFVPIVPAFQSTSSATVPANTFTTTSLMPFTMSLTNSLPSYSGKANEMPSKFITEFELRASGLFGYNDEYLLRAVQQVLSDTALTWFVQQQQELRITTWSQFKQLFLKRFRTPDKIESLRSRLRTLWQGDTEPTVDYFEKIKALISEIETGNSVEYLKRKFLQKLRKDIREKMPIGHTSSLSDLVQRAIDIETNIIQQQIDDKLRAAQKEDHHDPYQSTFVNNLFNVSETNSSSLPSHNAEQFYDNYAHHSNYNENQNYSGDKYTRTFTNSATSPSRPPVIDNASDIFRPIFNQNIKVKPRINNRWCSFCSSANHTWLYCYSNPNGHNYQPTHFNPKQQNQHEFIKQQPSRQYYSPAHSSPYSTSQQHFMPEDVSGSRH